jgi:hypothetical protein
MVVFLALLQLALVGVICIIELRRKSPVVFLWGTLAIMFGVMNLLSSISSNSSYSKSAIIESSAFTIFFSLIYLISRFILNSINSYNFKKFDYENIKNKLLNSRTTILTIIVLLVIGRSIYVTAKYSGGLLSTSWSLNRAYSTSLNYLSIDKISKVIFFSLSGLAVITFIKKQYKTTVLLILSMLFSVIVSRNRIEILPIAVSIIMLIIFSKKRIKLSTIMLVVFIGILVIYSIYGIRIFRHAGTMDNFFSMYTLSTFNDKVFEHINTDNGDLGLRKYFYYFILNDNQFPGFGQGSTYIRMMLVYIPTRFAFGLKPADFAVTMGAAVGASIGGSIHPTLFGDCYANIGWYGILLGMFWAIFAYIGDAIIVTRKKMNDSILIYAIYAVSYVIIGRGSVYNGFIYIAYGVPIIILIRFLCNSTPKIVLSKQLNY